jgi:hypothetical protein
VEAASIPRRTSRRRRPTWKAQAALLLYAVAALLAWSLVSGASSLAPATETAEATPSTSAPLAPSSTDLALGTLAKRASRSVATIGASSGFVAWTANGLSLVVTARPAGGWKTGPARAVTVKLNGERHKGTLVRSNPRTGLGLVRVAGVLPRPLWQQRGPAAVASGDRLVAVTADGSTTFDTKTVGAGAIWGLGTGFAPGAPVVSESGRLVGVTTAGGRVVPIGRLCGSIRRC